MRHLHRLVSRRHGRGVLGCSNAFAYLSNAVARTFVSARCPRGRRSSSVRSTAAAATITAAALRKDVSRDEVSWRTEALKHTGRSEMISSRLRSMMLVILISRG